FAERSYPAWLFRAQRYGDYKKLLLASFDREDARKNFSEYTYYYKYLGMWNWVELLPSPYFTEDLLETLTDIVTYPKGRMCSEFAHRSFQICALLFSGILVNGRCREVFYIFMRQLQYARYFMSSASDMDGETRDGWDKYFMTRDVNLCVKKLEKLGFRVPSDVLRQCNFMKLTFCFYQGDPNDGMFSCDKLLEEEGFQKDICVLNDTAEKVFFPEVSETRAFYNTMSLQSYLTGTDEEDWEFIDFSVNNLADPPMACNAAEDSLREKYSSRPMPAEIVRRLAFIEEVRRRYR
ncbi:MAG: hypothetical protein K6C06_05270, partial [Lachnospiraceae bacterium]|nr:hypothetical protein [Lachnospiraceae bacterium]